MSNPISASSEVVMHFTIKLSDGSAADSTKVNGKPAKFRMGDGSLTDNFEKCLLGLSSGEQKSFVLEPQDAFGEPNPDNIYHVDRAKFADELPEEGAVMLFEQPNGSEIPGIIRAVAGDSVTVDFNHPLAGQTLTFEVEIIEVRD
ncbi:FKBP-type peptidyl-prolyl cis-trans isomerase [Gallaecimonas kandeliae]|uniref:FKBP-type peptidyl-prolyl cis-trans isomerase n=1 Tax=Gallaecimonas kandeliae TaxID=3029055 RepID=UPI002649786F|nr:FKBP-type peptidyl-prolyl cis-trans isomerase [Gallaecimonas kandeliae]WKE64961.1 FKBP-type peptidyl-prolyl cis-trans isomerase [Gallaecimonas kandeliae]